MPAKLTREDDTLVLSLSGLGGSEFKDALSKAKSVPGRRFDGGRKVWTYPDDIEIAERIIHAIQPEASPDILQWIKSARAERSGDLTTKLPEDAQLSVPWADKLYPYQRAGVEFLVNHPHSILADDLGLGKTLSAITAVYEQAARGPFLVVAPNSVKGVWASEIERWSGGSSTIIDATNPSARDRQLSKAVERADWVIVNWEKLRIMPELAEVSWYAVIADEAHRAKNRKAKQTKALWKLKAPIQYALTGTPLLNDPSELWAVLKWLFPDVYRGYWSFYESFVEYYEGYFGKIITGVRNPDALRYELGDKLARRTKQEVLDLPPLVRQRIRVPLKPAQRKLYDSATKDFWLEVKQTYENEEDEEARKRLAASIEAGDAKALSYILPNGAARTTRLRQIASSPALLGAADDSAKLDAAVELITDQRGKSFVVFCHFKMTCALLKDRLEKKKITAATLTGDDSPEDRTNMVEAFQHEETQVLICTIAAGGVGLTLTAADTAIFVERDWVPANNEQSEARLHRIGQDSKVTAVILEAENTIDDGKIEPTNQVKSLIVGTVIETDQIQEETPA